MLRERAATAGLSPIRLAGILGIVATSARRALDRNAPEAIAIITAWELMSAEQRAAWLAGLGVDANRPRRGRPRKAVVMARAATAVRRRQ